MIQKKLAQSFGVAQDAVPKARIDDFFHLASQTSQQERESLYAVTRYAYSGEGEVWDIGCAAGGSSFCLAAGIQDNEFLSNEGGMVKCFDLFAGYSANTFKGLFSDNMSDMDIFYSQTSPIRNFVKAEKLNLITDLKRYRTERPIEIAHIDAAKSLELWKSIFEKVSAAIIPNKTIWIYQDFERARLPWQIYSLAEMMRFGKIIGGANYGTLYFMFNSEISNETREKIIKDDFSMAERIKNVRSVFDTIRNYHMSFFVSERVNIDDIENTMVAYCYYWNNQKNKANKILKDTSKNYLLLPGNKIYSEEISGTLKKRCFHKISALKSLITNKRRVR